MMKSKTIMTLVNLALLALLFNAIVYAQEWTEEDERTLQLAEDVLNEKESGGLFGLLNLSNGGIIAIILVVICWLISRKQESGKAKSITWILGAALIAAAFFGKFPLLQGIGSGGKALLGYGWLPLGIVILVGIFVIFPIKEIYKRDKETKEKIQRIGDWLVKSGVQKFFDLWRAMQWEKAKARTATVPGKWPRVWDNNRPLFQALGNYSKRSEIFYNYWGFVARSSYMVEKMRHENEIGTYPNFEDVKKDLYSYKFGEYLEENGGRKASKNGWNSRNLELMGNLNKFLIRFEVLRIRREGAIAKKENMEEINTSIITLLSKMGKMVDEIGEDIHKQLYPSYLDRQKAYGGHIVLQNISWLFWDQLNVSGTSMYFPHTYIFAKPGSKFICPNGAVENVQKVDERGGTDLGPQVDIYGYDVESDFDNRDLLGGRKTKKKPRRLRFVDDDGNPIKPIVYTNPELFLKVIEGMSTDWGEFINDVRFGVHHPWTRATGKYVEWLNKLKIVGSAIDDSKIGFSPHSTSVEPAFDLFAKENTAMFKYTGRRKFYDEPSVINKQLGLENPFPTLSTKGLATVLKELVYTDVKEDHERHEFYNLWPEDTKAVPSREAGPKGIIARMHGK